MRRIKGLVIVVLVLVLALVLAVAGCKGVDGDTAESGKTTSGQTDAGGAATPDTGDEAADAGAEIPPGREIAEGGGGPVQYTFREEWRRALAGATTWRAGATLIEASGDQVNNEGIPSSWRLVFMDEADKTTVLFVYMDPWGTVTEKREVTGDEVGSFITGYTKPVPYDIIDSDKAVALGSEAIAAKYDLAKTRDPRLGLGYSVVDGSGPWWYYSLFYTSSAEYVSANVNALTGEIKPDE